MFDFSKYESLIQELATIEAEVATMGNKLKDVEEHKIELEIELNKVRQENFYLQKRILDIEQELINSREKNDGNIFNTFNSKEKESIKVKLQDMISKIEYHLSGDRQS